MAQVEKVVFRRGPAATIPVEKVPGTLLVETDTGTVYVDDSYELRVQLKDNTKLPLSGGKVGPIEVSEHVKVGKNFQITETGPVSSPEVLAQWEKWLGLEGVEEALTKILGV